MASGTLIDGRYELVHALGSGTFGEVWRARDRKFSQRSVAIKLLKTDLVDSPEIVERFGAEAEALGLLHHPNLVAASDRGMADGRHYLVMELVEGESLARWLAEQRAIPRDVLYSIFDQICAGVAAAHQVTRPGPIVHRDLKPENIAIRIGSSGDVIVKVLDFGIAQLGSRRRTASGALLGTPLYMAPEQATGRTADIGPWTDVFSLGVLLLELLVMRADAGGGESWWSVALQRRLELPTLRSDVPAGVATVVQRCLAANIRERYQDAAALQRAFRGAWTGIDTGGDTLPADGIAQAPTRADRPPPRRKSRAVWGIVAILAAGAAGATAVVLVKKRGGHPEVRDAAVVHDAAPDAFLTKHGLDLVATDPEGAYRAFEVACKAGEQLGCANQAVLLVEGRGTTRDVSRAFELSRVACDAKEMVACSNLGAMYDGGVGTEADPKRAAELFRTACNAGRGDACTNLGLLFEHGRGVARDERQAAELYRKECDREAGQACVRLGLLYHTGTGVLRDDTKAIPLFEKACNANVMLGCTTLASQYFAGEGVAKDEAHAAQLLEKACNADDGLGCLNLGQLVQNGVGVAKDVTKAIELYRRACKHGYPEGCYHGALLLGTDWASAAELYLEGCNQNEGKSCTNLGALYWKGQGVPKDKESARRFFERGCAAGSKAGCTNAKTAK